MHMTISISGNPAQHVCLAISPSGNPALNMHMAAYYYGPWSSLGQRIQRCCAKATERHQMAAHVVSCETVPSPPGPRRRQTPTHPSPPLCRPTLHLLPPMDYNGTHIHCHGQQCAVRGGQELFLHAAPPVHLSTPARRGPGTITPCSPQPRSLALTCCPNYRQRY
jgi:hypothetical protein